MDYLLLQKYQELVLTILIYVYSKDDEVIETGDSLYRLLVAHPVLSQPAAAQLVYTAYSGWISSGTSSWTVDKVLVTDAFGKRYAVQSH